MGDSTQNQPPKVFKRDFTIRTSEVDSNARAEPTTRIIDPELARHMAKKGDYLRTKQAIALLISKSAWLKDNTTPCGQTKPTVPVIRRRHPDWRQDFSDMGLSPPSRLTSPIYESGVVWAVAEAVDAKMMAITESGVAPSNYYVALDVAEQADSVAVTFGAQASAKEVVAAYEYTRDIEAHAIAVDAHKRRREAVAHTLSWNN